GKLGRAGTELPLRKVTRPQRQLGGLGEPALSRQFARLTPEGFELAVHPGRLRGGRRHYQQQRQDDPGRRNKERLSHWSCHIMRVMIVAGFPANVQARKGPGSSAGSRAQQPVADCKPLAVRLQTARNNWDCLRFLSYLRLRRRG